MNPDDKIPPPPPVPVMTIREASNENLETDDDPLQDAPSSPTPITLNDNRTVPARMMRLNDNSSNTNNNSQYPQTSQLFPHPPRPRPSLASSTTAGGRLSTRELNFGIPTNHGAEQHIVELHGPNSWRERILKVLHQPMIQWTLMILLLLDILILFSELFLLAWFPTCDTIERDCVACCGGGEEGGDDHRQRILMESFVRVLAQATHGDDEDAHHGDDDDHHHDVCQDYLHEWDTTTTTNTTKSSYHGIAACDEHKWSQVHTAELALFWLTMIILTVFLLELHLEILALGPSIFFRQVFYALDYVIVAVSWTLELVFHIDQQDAIQSIVGIVVFARCWRFVRIGHGLIEITSEWTHQHYHEIMEYAKALEETVEGNGLELPPTEDSVRKAMAEVGSSHHGGDSNGGGGGKSLSKKDPEDAGGTTEQESL